MSGFDAQDDRTDLQNLLIDFNKFFVDILEHGILSTSKTLNNMIRNVWSNHINGELNTAAENANNFSLTELESCGLTGIQLKLKMEVFKQLRDLYYKLFKKIGPYSNKLINDILDLIKSIIGSLGKLIPGGELIIEFIDATKGALNIDHWETLPRHMTHG